MEAIGVVATCVAVPFIYNSVRKRLKTSVNCWFCNTDQRVDYKNRNCFVCTHCDQYNGFDESGGYNTRVLGQHDSHQITPVPRYCDNLRKSSRPDVIPGESTNGLCDQCNRLQAVIMKKISDFEPIREDRWQDELEEYKYKLNKVYALCPSCILYTQTKLQSDKKQYGYLLTLQHTVAPSLVSAIKSVTNAANKVVLHHGRQFFAGGRITETMHLITFIMSVLLFLSQLDYLQQDAEVSLIPFPTLILLGLPFILSIAHYLVGILVTAHIIGIWINRCRTTLPDLILPIIATMHLISFTITENVFREDLALFRCAFASFEALLATAVTFVPRKRKHKRKPNRMLSSAFSVASTPMSQCSSRLSSSNVSLLDTTDVVTPKQSTTMRWRERKRGLDIAAAAVENDINQDHEEMDWESSVNDVTSNICRETTPARELAPSLSSLSLLTKEERGIPSSIKRRGPFTSMKYNPNVRTPFAVLGDFKSPIIHSARPLRIDDSPTRSVFTSVSQQEMAASNSRCFMAFVATIAVSSLIGNIAFFYFVFKKQ
uniref:Ima1_N domain-containing protein n=1 Tax=Heterorhabditis bacteriophora TaxID=37862 RepID=A0A1I7XHH8_HETBA